MPALCRFGFGTESPLDFDLLTKKIETILQRRGFEIISRVRMDEFLGEVGQTFTGRYLVFGSCHPEYAQALISTDLNIGLLMPCILVVYECEQGGCKVMIKDPSLMMELIDGPIAIEATIKIKQQMEEVLEEVLALGKQSLASRLNPFRSQTE
jgi:uncharacterized protein (DUF302 family)